MEPEPRTARPLLGGHGAPNGGRHADMQTCDDKNSEIAFGLNYGA